jgi:hypothetical protein
MTLSSGQAPARAHTPALVPLRENREAAAERLGTTTLRGQASQHHRNIRDCQERRQGRASHHVPGVSDQTTLLAVTRTGTADDEVPVRHLGPADLLAAWPRED